MDNDNAHSPLPPSLPGDARLPINRCNLPAVILGSITFQRHPTRLFIDGVRELHRSLFDTLDNLSDADHRAERFEDYTAVHFTLHDLEQAGFDPNSPNDRGNADYRHTLRGWSFNADNREGAVLKGWVESRFGLLTRHHRESLSSAGAYEHFTQARAAALYNTNGLEAQLDLLFTYTQYELYERRYVEEHRTLYRGVNRLEKHEILKQKGKRYIALLNNINSFTASRERAEEFGDYVFKVNVPLAKIFLTSDMLPRMLQGESEHIVIGGLYEMERVF